MRDIDIAKKYLLDHDLSLVVVREGDILFESSGRGIKPLYDLIIKSPDLLKDAIVADKVTGTAAARLCRKWGIKANYGKLMSQGAVQVFESAGIYFEADQLVESIRNRDGSDLCPMEKISANSEDYAALIDHIQAFLQAIANNK